MDECKPLVFGEYIDKVGQLEEAAAARGDGVPPEDPPIDWVGRRCKLTPG